jgi:small-conductance mechanosensitive channel
MTQLGFWLQAGNVSGRVQDIGFMQTKVQGFDGVPVIVPNQAFTSQVSTFNSKFWYLFGFV